MESLPIRLTVGSYPEIVTHPQRSKATLRYLFESIVFKDLFAIAGIRRSEQFLHLVRLLAANIGNLCSFSSLGQQCGLSTPTVERCVSLLEQSFIVKTLPCYSSNFATELKIQENLLLRSGHPKRRTRQFHAILISQRFGTRSSLGKFCHHRAAQMASLSTRRNTTLLLARPQQKRSGSFGSRRRRFASRL